ncbi:hypothetical protein [Kribbella sp. NPDC023855]|uniref:hypothetical protein n=1 Tax=Kribbella sp. NPDC023855 TaxID=3154698 RepID=UPI0033C1F529
MDFQGVGAASGVADVVAGCIVILLLSLGTPGRPTARIGWGFLAVSTAGLVLQSVVAWLPEGTVDHLGLVALASAFPIVRSQRFDPILTVMTAGVGAVVLTLLALIFRFSDFHEFALFTAAAMAAVVALMKLGETILLLNTARQVPLFLKWWNWVLAGLLVAVPGQAVVTFLAVPSWLVWIVMTISALALSGGIQVVNACLLVRRHRAFALACAEPSPTRQAFGRDVALSVAAPLLALEILAVALSPVAIPAGLRAALLIAAMLCLVMATQLQLRMRARVVGYDSTRRELMRRAMSTNLVPPALDDPVYRLLPAFPMEE